MSFSRGFCLTVSHSVNGLAVFVRDALSSELEAGRLARAGYGLFASGCSTNASFPGLRLASYITARLQNDGGWSDIEETIWCLSYLSYFKEIYGTELTNGRDWLCSVRLSCGAWGKSLRDQPRIPVTALVSILLPGIVDGKALTWLSDQWEADLDGTTPLTYKGAFYLLSTSHCQAHSSGKLIERTIAYLEQEQNEDGGFSPWKGHPIGSCPWTTGVVLWGLSKTVSKVSSHTLKRAVSWLESKQLPNGLWPYHYLDDATAMVLIGR
jgi:hypothetical protein